MLANTWTAFGAPEGGKGCDGPIYASAVLPNGQLMVGGNFTRCGAVNAENLAVWDGQNWQPFAGGGVTAVVTGSVTGVQVIKVQGNTICIGGIFSAVGNVVANGVACWNGATWDALNNGVNGTARALEFDGQAMYVGGFFNQAGGVTANNIAKYDQGQWTALGSAASNGVNGEVRALQMFQGELHVGGRFQLAAGQTVNNLARWNGAQWSALIDSTSAVGIPPGPTGAGTVLDLDVDGPRLLVAGAFVQAGSLVANSVAYWNGSGWSPLGPTNGPGVRGTVNVVLVDAGTTYLVGFFNGGNVNQNIAIWNGTQWTSDFRGATSGAINAATLVGSLVYLSGEMRQLNGVAVNGIASISGTQIAALGAGNGKGFNGPIVAVLVNGTDVFVGGAFTQVGKKAVNNIARWDGSEWQPLNGVLGNGVNGFYSFTSNTYPVEALAHDGTTLFVGGSFSSTASTASRNIASWNPIVGWRAVGAIDAGVLVGVGQFISTGVNALHFHQGAIYAGGALRTASGQPANLVARWNGTQWINLGGALPSNTALQNRVWTFGSRGTELIAAGSFSTIGGVSANSVAVWNGTTWSALGSGVMGEALTVAVDGSDIYVGGRFAGDTGPVAIQRWNGSNWQAFGPPLQAPNAQPGTVLSLLSTSEGLYAGGDFVQSGPQALNNITRWNGSAWVALDGGVSAGAPSSFVRAMARAGANIYVGGNFLSAGGLASHGIAQWGQAEQIFVNGFEN